MVWRREEGGPRAQLVRARMPSARLRPVRLQPARGGTRRLMMVAFIETNITCTHPATPKKTIRNRRVA